MAKPISYLFGVAVCVDALAIAICLGGDFIREIISIILLPIDVNEGM